MTRRTLFALALLASPVILTAQTEGRLYVPPRIAARGTMTSGITLKADAGEQRVMLAAPVFGDVREIELPRVLRHGNTMPLLPVLYFDSPGSITIPERYHRFAAPHEADLYTDSAFVPAATFGSLGGNDPWMRKYHQLLDIIGYRMRRHPDAVVGLEGWYADEPGESPQTANDRATVVREYLTSVWRIPAQQLPILPPNTPADSALPSHRRAESRCVRFVSSRWDIIGPLRFTTSESVPTTLMLGVSIDPKVPAGDVREIELAIALGDDIMLRTTLPGHPDSVHYSFTGTADIPRAADTLPQPVSVQVTVTTSTGTQLASEALVLPFVERTRHERADEAAMAKWMTIPFYGWRSRKLDPLQTQYLDSISAELKRSLTSDNDIRIRTSDEASEAFPGEIPTAIGSSPFEGMMKRMEMMQSERGKSTPVMRSMASINEQLQRFIGRRAQAPAQRDEETPKTAEDSVRVDSYNYLNDSLARPRMAAIRSELTRRTAPDTVESETGVRMIAEPLIFDDERNGRDEWLGRLLLLSKLPEERAYQRSIAIEPYRGRDPFRNEDGSVTIPSYLFQMNWQRE